MSAARYQKFVKDVEYDVRATVEKNVEILKALQGAAVDPDIRLDWIAPSVRMTANVVDLVGDVWAHWRNFALASEPNRLSEDW